MSHDPPGRRTRPAGRLLGHALRHGSGVSIRSDRPVLRLHCRLPRTPMRTLDWVVLVGATLGIVLYGLYKGRGSGTVSSYLLANRSMPWWAMGLSIMATQASAITFIGTTGQSYVDGMRFVQFYFGLPLAMIILSATLVPLFRRSGAYTAYEYLEKRFDGKTRTLTCIVFLIQRGSGVGLALYAPAIVLSVMLGWSERWTILMMGVLMV